jgi:hypothetical protein
MQMRIDKALDFSPLPQNLWVNSAAGVITAFFSLFSVRERLAAATIFGRPEHA